MGRADALNTLELVAKEAEVAGEYVTASRALHNLSLFQPADLADATLDRMSEVADEGGFDLASAVLLPMRKADVAVARADLRAAQEWIDRARPMVQRLRSGKHLLYDEMIVRLESGVDIDPDELEPLLDQLPSDESWTWSIRLRWAARHGQHDRVAELLSAPVDARYTLIGLSAGLVEFAAAKTDPSLVSACRDATLSTGTEQEGHDIAAALLAEFLNEPDAAEQLAALASDANDSAVKGGTKAPYGQMMVAGVLLAQARIHARQGRRAEAQEHARHAAELLSRWPGPRRDEALALAADEVCSSELTGREIDVARLVARGMTNGQIADELFIARKTVSTHVSHILSKLAMTSRTEIATWAVTTGLAPTGLTPTVG